MGHVDLFKVSHFNQIVGEGLNLGIGKSALHKVKSLDWCHLQQISENRARQLIVIAVELSNASFFDLGHQCLSTSVINFVILQLKLLQGGTLIHQVANGLCTN